MSDVENAKIEVESTTGSIQDMDEEVEATSNLKSNIMKGAFVLAWIAYSIAAFAIDFDKAEPLLYINCVVLALVGIKLINNFMGDKVTNAVIAIENFLERIQENKVAGITTAVVIFGGMLTISIILLATDEDEDALERLIAVAGLFVFVFGQWAFSFKRSAIKWRPVVGGLLFQFLFGIFILRIEVGKNIFQFFGDQINALLDYTKAGSTFVYGELASGRQDFNPNLPPYLIFDNESNPIQAGNTFGIFNFSVIPTVIFFASLTSILYHIGVIQAIVRVIGRFLAVLLGTSASESLNAAGNIFVGQTEAPLLIKPFLKDMTKSELHAVMTGGFATIAGGVLGVYIKFGVDATHLLGASVMSAPAALAISKLAYPETEESKTAAGVEYEIESNNCSNIIEAAARGASDAIMLALNIAAQLIAFLAIVAMVDAWLFFFGSMVGLDNLSFQLIASYVFYPFAFIMGVKPDDCLQIAGLLGTKIFVNEFVAYEELAKLYEAEEIAQHSFVVATYALCGFSNFGSIGIQLGGLTPLAPNQEKNLAKLVFSAMIAGNTACFMTACVASLLYDSSTVVAPIN